jgi:hypothetical protein
MLRRRTPRITGTEEFIVFSERTAPRSPVHPMVRRIEVPSDAPQPVFRIFATVVETTTPAHFTAESPFHATG